MVVMSSTESSSFNLTFPPISDVVFVMEETTATSLYLMSEIRDNYIVPTLENFGESSVRVLIVVKESLKYIYREWRRGQKTYTILGTDQMLKHLHHHFV